MTDGVREPGELQQLALAAEVARRYFLGEESKSQIGERLGISRFKVARLLDAAREAGLVRIEIRDPEPTDDLAAALVASYGLRACSVVAGHAGGREAVGRRGAVVLQGIVKPDDVLGLAWSRTVTELVRSVSSLPPVEVVQLCGSLVVPGDDGPVDIVRAAGRLTGAASHLFYAPLLADDPGSAAVIRRQPTVAAALAAADRVSIAVVSVGAWLPGQSSVHDVVSAEAQAAVARSGAVGEVLGLLFDKDGQLVRTPLSESLVGISGAQLQGFETVLGVVAGASKGEAVEGALRGGLINQLVVDLDLAQDLIARAG